MSEIQLDPRVVRVQTVAKVAGAGVITVAGAAIVVVAGGAAMAVGIAAIAGLTAIHLVPVAARALALWRQKSLTALAETFSEETILEDERKEHDRLKVLKEQYKVTKAELEGSIDELTNQLEGASDVERETIETQIKTMREVIDNAYTALEARSKDLEELTRVNKLYITLHRSATALEKAQGAERDSQQIQNVELARNSIKTRMRAAMAGQQIEQMNRSSGRKLEIPTIGKK
jgi:hypothetical protein